MSARAAAPSPAAPRGNDIQRPRHPASSDAHHARLKLTPRAAALVFAMFLVAVIAIAPARTYVEQRDRLADLEGQLAAMDRANDDLRGAIADLHDARTLERLARECLGMVLPGETGFVVIPKNEAPTPPDCG